VLPTRKKVNIFFFFAFDEDTGITTPYHIDEQDISPEEFEFFNNTIRKVWSVHEISQIVMMLNNILRK